MSDAMILRPERPGEEDQIYQLTKSAFDGVAYSDGSEPDIVNRLRSDGDLAISLVALAEERIVGHVAFSPVSITEAKGEWFGLGPISIDPEMQKQGIGRSLIAEGLDYLRRRGAAGCVLIGNPEVYRSSGFVSDGRISWRDVPAEYVQYNSLSGDLPRGEITYAPALQG